MTKAIDIKSYYVVSNDVIAKKLEDEYVIVPLISGVGDLDSEIYSLNKTGSLVWEKLDGKKNLEEIIFVLSREFNISQKEIMEDILELIVELLEKGFIFEKHGA